VPSSASVSAVRPHPSWLRPADDDQVSYYLYWRLILIVHFFETLHVLVQAVIGQPKLWFPGALVEAGRALP
jgi:hypothetical protein